MRPSCRSSASSRSSTSGCRTTTSTSSPRTRRAYMSIHICTHMHIFLLLNTFILFYVVS